MSRFTTTVTSQDGRKQLRYVIMAHTAEKACWTLAWIGRKCFGWDCNVLAQAVCGNDVTEIACWKSEITWRSQWLLASRRKASKP